MKSTMRLKHVVLLVIGIFVLMPAVGLVGFLHLTKRAPTEVMNDVSFAGIKELRNPTTNIIIIHGIGDHCIGYADSIIQGLATAIADDRPQTIRESYLANWKALMMDKTKGDKPESASGWDNPYPLLDGKCQAREDVMRQIYDVVPREAFDPTVTTNVETRTLAQNDLCKSIKKTAHEKGDKSHVFCDFLSVEYLLREEQRDGSVELFNESYITGFIRTVIHPVSNNRNLRFVELTWSPATRWIKGALDNLERLNLSNSAHSINQFIKHDVINSSIADAVAYLSHNGVMVRLDVLLALCSVFADPIARGDLEPFTCDETVLSDNPEFSSKNDVVLVTHSLGTRILLDTLGMLARGVEPDDDIDAALPGAGGNQLVSRDGDLLSSFEVEFSDIGAIFPASYKHPAYRSGLSRSISQLAASIKMVFVFTNQVPLLFANLSSPLLSDKPDPGAGFSEFLDLRMDGEGPTPPLQIVSFHDPDDVLSYDLACWYHQVVVRRDKETRNIIDAEAEHRLDRNDPGGQSGDFDALGMERRALSDPLFRDHCLIDKLKNNDQQVYRELWEKHEALIKLVGVTVRLGGRRYGFVGHPTDLHSNYFTDKDIHELVANGNQKASTNAKTLRTVGPLHRVAADDDGDRFQRAGGGSSGTGRPQRMSPGWRRAKALPLTAAERVLRG